MSFSAAHDAKEQVREATDIVSLLGSYMQLQPQGRNFVALCPFHDDTRPSLQINPERQTWKCWPCDAGGDVFSFVMQHENVDFPGAMRILAERAGIELRSQGPTAKPGSPDDKATLYKAMAWAENEFHRFLLEASEAAVARDYLRERDIQEESIARYQIGYAPKEWQWLTERARSTPYSSIVLEALGLVIKNEKGRVYDRFRGRLMFPIRDTQSRPIAVGGRILPAYADENSAKYINSPETRLYTKSEQLYGLNLSREGLEQQRKQNQIRNVIVMEGYTDVVVSRQAGVLTPVAVCGTALGARHIRLLRRYADRVTLVLDGDEAGQRRAADVLDLFIAGQVELRMVTLPDGLDPCDFVLQHGADALQQLIEQSPDALEFCVQRETAGIDLARDTQRAHAAMQRILGTMSKAPRSQEDSEAAFRMREQQTLSRIARMFAVDEGLLRQELVELRSKSNRFEPQVVAPVESKPGLNGWERELFTLLIQTPDAIAAVIENISEEDLRTDSARQLLLIYQELEVEGKVADFQQVMDAIEEPPLKNLLVELGELADRNQPEDSDLQLRELLDAFRRRREQQRRRQHVSQLNAPDLKKEQELALLKELFESKRHDAE